MTLRLTALYRYPLKSCAAEPMDKAVVEPRGLRDDRRWMVVDANGRFITGREHPALTRIRAAADGMHLHLASPDLGDIDIDADAAASRVSVTVWGDRVDALPATNDGDHWISKALGQPAQLVYMDADAHRDVDAKYAAQGDEVSFADGFPLLLISQASLDGLNARLKHPVSMLRFRPNLVVDAMESHDEDQWRRLRIGDIEFDVAKPCKRCVFTTVDPDLGERDADGEPLRTLLGYRRAASGGATFGMNLIPRGSGTLHVGDPLTVLG